MPDLNANAARSIGLISAALGALGFSFKAVFIKAAYRYGVDAETLLALRMGYALPFFLAMGWVTHRRQPLRLTGRDGALLVVLGVTGYYAASYLDFLGLRYISASLERLILFIYPTLVLVLSALFMGKPLTKQVILSMVLCYAGIAVALSHDFKVAGSHVWLGGSLVLLSAVSYAIYLLLSGAVVQRLGAVRVTAFATGLACVLSLLQFVLMRPITALIQPWPVHVLGMCMALFSTVLPVWLVAEAMRRIGAGTTSLVGTLGPVLTMVLAVVFLDEPFTWMQLIGASLVIAGVLNLR